MGLCCIGCIYQIYGIEGEKQIRPFAPALGLRLRGMGAGDLRPKTAMQVITEIDPKTGAIFARNPYNSSSLTGPRSLMRVNRPGP